MDNSKKLLFVTGTRADFGKIEPLAVAARDSGFQIKFFITGMHMMRRYGETRLEVRRFQNAEFFEFVNQKEGDAQELVLSKTILGFSDFVHEYRPDLVVIHGDRIEAMAASIVCGMKYILSGHIEGGEVSGNIDESIRHCNTKLCAAHFVSSEAAKSKVLALGESPDRVFNIGSPELDIHEGASGVSIEAVKSHYGIQFHDYGVVIFHPVTSEVGTIEAQARSLFRELENSGRSFVVIAPNNDPGTDKIFNVIDGLPAERFKIIASMRFRHFSELMKNAAVIVGNSSAGVREAPFLGLPSLNIGTRQNKRALSSSVVNCSPFDNVCIASFLSNKWNQRGDRSNQFGDGKSTARFVAVLKSDGFWGLSPQKSYHV